MPLNFPNNPTVGQIYQSGSSATYQFNSQRYWTAILPPVQTAFLVPWSSNEAITITATTTNPTKATTRVDDYIRYRQVGPKEYEIQMMYSHTNNTGASNGNGTYLFTLPAGLQFDTTFNPVYASTNFMDGTPASVRSVIEGSSGYTSNMATYSSMVARAYDSTRFMIGTHASFGGGASVNVPLTSGYYQITNASLVYSMRFTFTAA